MSDTWHDIEILALHNPVLQMAVTLVSQGRATREEALIAAVGVYSKQAAAIHGAMVNARNFGNGFVHIAYRDAEFKFQQLDPTSVIIKRMHPIPTKDTIE